MLEGAGDPSVVVLGGRERVYVARPDTAGIWLAERAAPAPGEAGAALGLVGPVLLPRPTVVDAFDEDGLLAPGATVVPTLDPDEPARVALYVVGVRTEGSREPMSAIGWAGSFDGVRFERAGVDPVLDGGPPGEDGPSVVLEPDRALLFFHEARGGRPSIAVAVER